QIAFINEQIEKKWDDNKITNAPRCSDYEFIRRATLDICGRIATPSEIQKFMSWPATQRRSKLIDELLKSSDFPRHMSDVWTNLMITRTGQKMYREQMEVWLQTKREENDADWSEIVGKILTATGQTNENGAVNFILAHLDEPIPGNPQKNGKFDMVPLTSR